ncbi:MULTISPECIES: response regulator transcription factor [Pseudomonas]|uniref:LuxR family transcriptional regulator n=1 Tax=Pseudomonas fluorescens LMG 5329 TaxID=1324332 RepID=A0A0A1Z4H6_PSEFL|nr:MULTISPECIES: response regulator transcription factor [Pseudomonas]KGE69190.1 LuxR family transcriptional regulator [Pseudomonas fluorescens LMG 5329]NWE01729.1 response regulator transcription factor [Pseudomonas sp. IPO3749]NWF22992.1 response regulator transcription factor [Pseudomonas sp. IPO3749]
MYRALVVDDHPFIRASVKALLVGLGFGVVWEAGNGAQGLQWASEQVPDLVILEIMLPDQNGLEVIAQLAGLNPPCKVLVLTAQSAQCYVTRCRKAGAAGFLSKCNALDELVKGVKTLMDGYTFFPDLATHAVRPRDVQSTDDELIARLSERELSILRQLSLGLSNKQIGDALQISNKTVSTYKTRLIEKLNVKSVVYLAEFARRNHLV